MNEILAGLAAMFGIMPAVTRTSPFESAAEKEREFEAIDRERRSHRDDIINMARLG